MSALETLLLPPGIKKGKGNKLAVILRDLGGTPWAPAGIKFTTWFVDLYNRRNDATHQGISYNEDANVRRLLGLTHASIHWACNTTSFDRTPARMRARHAQRLRRLSPLTEGFGYPSRTLQLAVPDVTISLSIELCRELGP